MGPNIMKLMKQAASMQKEMEKVQNGLAEKTVEFSAAGGMIKVEACGDMSIKSLKIDPKIVDPDDTEMLEDAIMAAISGAMGKAKEMASEEMSKVTAGMGLPGGGGLPF